MYNEQIQNILLAIFSDVNKISIENITEEEINRIYTNTKNVTGRVATNPEPIVLTGYLNGIIPFIITDPQKGMGYLHFQTEKTLQTMYLNQDKSEKYDILIDADGTNIQKNGGGVSVGKTIRNQNGDITHSTQYIEDFGVIKNTSDSEIAYALKASNYLVTCIREYGLKKKLEHPDLLKLFESDTRYMSKKTYWDDDCTIEIGYYWNGENDLFEGQGPKIIYGSIEERTETRRGTRIFAFGLNQNNTYESIGVTSSPLSENLIDRLNNPASYEQIYDFNEVQKKVEEHGVNLFHSDLFINLRKIKPPVITSALVSYLKASNYISSLGGELEGTVKFDGIEINKPATQKSNNYSM